MKMSNKHALRQLTEVVP